MERLSSSPFTLDIYGNCGISQLTELAESSLFAHIVHARQAALLTSEEQLSIAHHVASGVADMHTAGIAHNDLSPDQFLLVNGIYKISDFHLASFTKQTQNDGTICKEKPQTMNLHVSAIYTAVYESFLVHHSLTIQSILAVGQGKSTRRVAIPRNQSTNTSRQGRRVGLGKLSVPNTHQTMGF